MRLPRRTQPELGAPVDALLRELDALRLTIDADLTVAAAAVEAYRPDLATDVIEADRAELVKFQRWAARHLTAAARTHPTVTEPAVSGRARPSRRWLLLPAAPALAAAAAGVIALAGGVVQAPDGGSARSQLAPVAASYAAFSEVARSDASRHHVIAAAERLHRSLEQLIERAGSDPDALRHALRILEAERAILVNDRPAGAAVLLEQARALVAKLHAKLPAALHDNGSRRDAPKQDPAELLPLIPPDASDDSAPADADANGDTDAPTSGPEPEPTPDNAKSDTDEPGSDPDATEDPEPDPTVEPSPPVEEPWPFGDMKIG